MSDLVTYWRMVMEQEQEARDLLDHTIEVIVPNVDPLGIDYSPECVSFHIVDGSEFELSAAQRLELARLGFRMAVVSRPGSSVTWTLEAPRTPEQAVA